MRYGHVEHQATLLRSYLIFMSILCLFIYLFFN